MFEERELTNASVEEGLTGFTKVKNTFDVYDAIHKNADNYVDEKFLLRSRLFDMMIGDWDRHEDQWRWFDSSNLMAGKCIAPYPGIVIRLLHLRWCSSHHCQPECSSHEKMQRYRPMPLSVDWFNFNGRNVDHNLLHRMTCEKIGAGYGGQHAHHHHGSGY